MILVFFSYFGYFKFLKKPEVVSNEDIIMRKFISFNTIKDVITFLKILRQRIIINASKGEIDINDSDVIFLTNVKAIINLKNSNKINISSNYGKYNTKNFDTIFSKNVIITYLDNKITSEYLDFSIEKNLMIISKNIVYTNPENILIADVLEMDIQTKDTKIYMYESKKKINIKSKN